MSDLTFLSAVSMAGQIREKKISPVELVDAHLKQIENLNPTLNAFVHVDANQARSAARDAEIAVLQGKSIGPLHGVPLSIKSSISVAGMRCESGTRPGVGFRPQMPVKCAGTRMEPPPSLPTPPADMPAAIAAASPPLEPPGVRRRSHGLLVGP